MKTRGLAVFWLIMLFALGLAVPLSGARAEHKPYPVVQMTTPFGTPLYTEGIAFEEVFKKAGSWVNWKAKETPGAMFVNRYWHENRAKIDSGEQPPVVTSFSASVMPFVIEGRPPFNKYPVPDSQALFSSPSFISMFLTFDEKIKTAKDFAGQKVGIAEKSRPFMGSLAISPYFGKGLGIWKKVDWQFIGPINSKDALLNDRIQAHFSTFRGSVKQQADGSFVCTKLAPATPTLELMNSGRKFHFVGFDPELFKNSYDFSKDMMLYPVLIKKETLKGLDRDIWALLSIGLYRGPASLPDEVVEEIIRIRYQKRDELAKFHAALSFFPEDPYPVGVPEKWVHPGVMKAMKKLGLR